MDHTILFLLGWSPDLNHMASAPCLLKIPGWSITSSIFRYFNFGYILILIIIILKSHDWIPYTRGNNTFQNMPQISTGLENSFAGPGWVWKPHKSKDQIFLHRNYVQIFFSTPKKYIFFLDPKKFRNFFRQKKSHEKISRKIRKHFRFQNFKNLKFLKF